MGRIQDAISGNFGLPVAGAVVDKAIAFFEAMYTGSGTPEGAVVAPTGSFYFDITNGAFYTKTSGSGDSGWELGAGSGGGVSEAFVQDAVNAHGALSFQETAGLVEAHGAVEDTSAICLIHSPVGVARGVHVFDEASEPASPADFDVWHAYPA